MENNEPIPEYSLVPFKQLNLLLSDSLWTQPRDKSRTPLFVERFKGVRHNPRFSVHNFWELTAVAGQDGTIECNGQNLKITKNDIILIPPKLPHREYSVKSLDTIWLGFKFSSLTLPRDKPIKLNSEELFKAIADMWNFASRRRGGIGLELDGKLLAIIGYYIRCLNEEVTQSNAPMEKILAYINEHFSDQISISQLAQMLQVSDSYFFRQFKNYTGRTPVEYLTDLRIKNIITNIRKTNLPIYQIARISGFSDPYYLSKTFKKITGMSPQQYRDSQNLLNNYNATEPEHDEEDMPADIKE